MSDRLNEQTHRLTDLPGPKHPLVCQLCGGSCFAGEGNGIMRHSLTRWQECDHNDKPEQRLLVICEKCERRVIKPHPRLYIQLDPRAPWPGCMDICVRCKLRDGIRCTAPEAKANGGAGVMITIQKPINAMVDGRNYSGPMQIWPAKATDCKQRQQVVEQEP